MHSHQGIRTSEFIRNSVSVNCIRLLVILWTVVCQAPPGILHGQNTGGDNTERMSGAVSQYDFILGGFPGGPVVRLCTPNAGEWAWVCSLVRELDFAGPHSMARKLKKKDKKTLVLDAGNGISFNFYTSWSTLLLSLSYPQPLKPAKTFAAMGCTQPG